MQVDSSEKFPGDRVESTLALKEHSVNVVNVVNVSRWQGWTLCSVADSAWMVPFQSVEFREGGKIVAIAE
jgi:hypothetical protein